MLGRTAVWDPPKPPQATPPGWPLAVFVSVALLAILLLVAVVFGAALRTADRRSRDLKLCRPRCAPAEVHSAESTWRETSPGVLVPDVRCYCAGGK
jgi:hypothetical protein